HRAVLGNSNGVNQLRRQVSLRAVLPTAREAILFGIEGEVIRDTKAVGRQQQGKDEAVATFAVDLLLLAAGLGRTFLAVAGGEGGAGALALVGVTGGVDDQHVKASLSLLGGLMEAELGGGQQGGRGIGTAQPT